MRVGEWIHGVLAGEGVVFAATTALILLLLSFGVRELLSRHDRKPNTPPFTFVLLYFVASLIADLVPMSAVTKRYVGFIALAFMLLSIVRIATMFVMDWVVRRRLNQEPPRIVRDIIEGVLAAVVLLVTLRRMGVDTGSLLTTSALLTAIIGLSLQDTLGNLFAGLSLQMQHPFRVGDWIQVDKEGLQIGEVLEINWRATTVRTLDSAELTIPNAFLARAVILNHSLPSTRVRRTVLVTVPSTFAPTRVRAALEKALAHVPGVRDDSEVTVVINSFLDLGMQYAVRFHIDDFAERERIESRVRDRIWLALDRVGIPIMTSEKPLPPKTPQTFEAHLGQLAAASLLHRRALERVDYLRGLPDAAMESLAHHARTQHYAAGEIVVRQGEQSDELYVCMSGDLHVSYAAGDEPPEVVGHIHPGEAFGEMALMTGAPRAATVTTETASELLMIDRDAFKEVVDQHPEVEEKIEECLVRRRQAIETIESAHAEVHEHGPAYKPDLMGRVRDFFSI